MSEGELVVVSPADLSDTVFRGTWSVRAVDEAFDAARAAFPAWRKSGFAARAELLKKYQAALTARASDLADAISREIGKPLWEAKTEVGAMVTKVDVTLSEGAQYVRDVRIDSLPGEIRHRPHGVVAVVGPFNFPGHLPNGQIVPALLAGNTVVFKPSDKGPLTAQLMQQCFAEAGFPPGVFNVVQGGVEVAQAVTQHKGVNAILFTGSLPVGRSIIAANAHRPGVLVALELGGKNASLVFDDAELERTVREVAFSGFATAGQRCTATSRVYVTKGIADAFVERLVQLTKGLRVGHPRDDVFMGPVISRGAVENLQRARALAVKHGYEAVLPGGEVPARTKGHYVTPSVHRVNGKGAAQGYSDTELFAPDLAIHVVDSVEQAVSLANETEYGLSAAVFTQRAELFERAADELEVGVLHWNKSSAGASGRLPFSGVKGSGNHRPAGILMGTSCVYPVGVLLPPAQPGALPVWPGITF